MMWQHSAEAYKELIEASDWDSKLLRERGLIPNILEFVGNCEDLVVLDAGTGTGWLFDYIKPAQAHACDIVPPGTLPEGVKFTQQEVRSLNYDAATFDLIVASLLLIYCEDIRGVCAEFYRVAKPGGGRLVVSLMHPYFYRTGKVTEEEHFLVTHDLSKPFEIPLKIAGQVGPVRYYYRPLPDYVNAFIATGWTIRRMHDWFINMADYRTIIDQGVRSKVQRTGRVPLFTFIECTAA